jgi:hypothetical protein
MAIIAGATIPLRVHARKGKTRKNQRKLANRPYILGKMIRAYTPYILGWREYIVSEIKVDALFSSHAYPSLPV